MIGPKIGKGAIAGVVLLMSGCLEPGANSISYPEHSSIAVIRESFSVDLKIDPQAGGFLVSGKPYDIFLQDLARISPQVIKLTPKHGTVDLSGLLADLWALSGNRRGQVVIASPNPDLLPEADIRLDISYFLYRVPTCGVALARRKLDQSGLITAGFGCAVERNLVLSLTDPSEWISHRVPDKRRYEPPLP